MAASAAGRQASSVNPGKAAITILERIDDKPTGPRILVNVVSMVHKIPWIANPMIRKSALPYLRLPSSERTEGVRVSALDELDRTLDRDIVSGSEQEMGMIRHEDKGMQRIAAFATLVVKSFEEQSRIVLDNKQPTTLPS